MADVACDHDRSILMRPTRDEVVGRARQEDSLDVDDIVAAFDQKFRRGLRHVFVDDEAHRATQLARLRSTASSAASMSESVSCGYSLWIDDLS